MEWPKIVPFLEDEMFFMIQLQNDGLKFPEAFISIFSIQSKEKVWLLKQERRAKNENAVKWINTSQNKRGGEKVGEKELEKDKKEKNKNYTR